MKKIRNKKILIITLIVLILNTISFVSLKCYAEQICLYEVSATSDLDENIPVVNKTITTPNITVNTDNVHVYSTECYWEKQKGERWVRYFKDVFDEGTYRYHYSLYIPLNIGRFSRYVTLSLDDYPIYMEPEVWEDDCMHFYGFSKSYTAQTSQLTSHLVTFDSNGGTPVHDKYIEHGKTIDSYETPTRDGFTFLGWYWYHMNEKTGKVQYEAFDFFTNRNG